MIPVEDLPPCRTCGGVELLRTDGKTQAIVLVAHQRTYVPFDILVCCACGDMRFVTDPKVIATLRTQEDTRAFRRVDAKQPPGGGPFR